MKIFTQQNQMVRWGGCIIDYDAPLHHLEWCRFCKKWTQIFKYWTYFNCLFRSL